MLGPERLPERRSMMALNVSAWRNADWVQRQSLPWILQIGVSPELRSMMASNVCERSSNGDELRLMMAVKVFAMWSWWPWCKADCVWESGALPSLLAASCLWRLLGATMTSWMWMSSWDVSCVPPFFAFVPAPLSSTFSGGHVAEQVWAAVVAAALLAARVVVEKPLVQMPCPAAGSASPAPAVLASGVHLRERDACRIFPTSPRAPLPWPCALESVRTPFPSALARLVPGSQGGFFCRRPCSIPAACVSNKRLL